MEQWVKSDTPQTGETEQKKQQKVVFRAPDRKSAKKEEDQVSPVLAVQLIFCLAVILFVLITRSLAPEYFAKLRTRYEQMLTEGVSLTSSGELFRFASAQIDTLQDKLRAVVGRLDGAEETDSSSGSQQSSSLGQGGQYEITHAEYLKTVTLAPYRLSDLPCMPVDGVLTSPFGYRTHPITGKTDFHTGVDLAAAEGTPIAAAWAGVVAETGQDEINGNYVKVIHSGTVCTTYNHLSKIAVTTGERLIRGQTVGLVGSTGVSTGPHLHFELLIDGVRVDPAPALGL